MSFYKRRSRAGANVENDFKYIARQVEELAATQLKGKAKIEWKAKQRKERGGVTAKNVKIPYKLLMSQKKKEKDKKQKQVEEDRERGIIIKQPKIRKNSLNAEDYMKQLRGNRRGDMRNIGDGTRGLKTSVGHFEGGVLHLSGGDIRAVEKRVNDQRSNKTFKRDRPSGNKYNNNNNNNNNNKMKKRKKGNNKKSNKKRKIF